MSQLKKEIVDLINTVCSTIKPDLTDLDRPLLEVGLDSLDYVSVLMAIEDKYDFEDKEVSFSSIEIEEIQTINAIIAFIENNKINE